MTLRPEQAHPFLNLLASGASAVIFLRLLIVVLILAPNSLAAHADSGLCGNAAIDPGESCDDGGLEGGDGCSSRCQIEASQTREQQKCLALLTGLTLKLTDVQSRVNSACFKNAGRGKLRDDQTLAECLAIEGERKSRGLAIKIATVQDGTPEAPGRSKCAERPDFGYVDDLILVDASLAETRRFLQELIVDPPEDVVINSTLSVNKAAGLCQRLVLRGADQLLRALLREFSHCEKKVLGDKSAPAVSAEDLEVCFAEVREDSRGRVAKMRERLMSIYDRKCAPVGVSLDEILGVDAGTTIESFASTTLVSSRCAMCRVLNATQNLRHDCDLWDDDSGNGSCVDEVLPSPRGAFVDGPTFAHF